MKTLCYILLPFSYLWVSLVLLNEMSGNFIQPLNCCCYLYFKSSQDDSCYYFLFYLHADTWMRGSRSPFARLFGFSLVIVLKVVKLRTKLESCGNNVCICLHSDEWQDEEKLFDCHFSMVELKDTFVFLPLGLGKDTRILYVVGLVLVWFGV